MRINWLTDIHINFLRKESRIAAGKFLSENADIMLISGDISESPELETHYKEFISEVAIPVYFVLGNHDFYNGSIVSTKENAGKLSGFLDNLGVVELNKDNCLIGCTSWYDARCGNALNSKINLNDFYVIKDFSYLKNKRDLISKIQLEADKESQFAEQLLEKAANSNYKNIYFMTHIPPFKEVHLDPYRNIGDDQWSPWFVNKLLGIVLTKIANKYPNKHFTVLCGHTHTGIEKMITSNLEVKVGNAYYNNPSIAKSIII